MRENSEVVIIYPDQMVLAQWEIQLPAYKETGNLTLFWGKMFSLESLGAAPTYQAMREVYPLGV